jgi:excisionase family DNA binding protein
VTKVPSLTSEGLQPSTEPGFFTPEQLAAYMQVPLRSIRKWAMERRIVGQVKVGRLWRFRRADIERAALPGNNILLSNEERERLAWKNRKR